VTSYGVSFELSANHSDLLREALEHLPLGCKPSGSAQPDLAYRLQGPTPSTQEPLYRLRRNGRQLFTSVHRQELLEHFHSTVSLDVAERSIRRTFVHAGVVGWGGFAIVIPGRSFAGKSTLVAALIRAGASYFSDEFAVIDKQGRVHPYARPLQLRAEGNPRQTSHPVEEFGAQAAVKPLTVKLILVTRHKPGASWRPRRLSPGIGLLQLLDNTVSARRSPAAALHNLKQVVGKAQTLRSSRGDASQVVNWLNLHFGPAQARRKGDS
jgi:serine kinase of HPr protein (carbohydrate metabolism regulator)